MIKRFPYFLSLVAAILSTITPVLYALEGESGDKPEPFHVVVSTKHMHWLADRQEAARVEVVNVPIDRLGEALRELRPILPDFNKSGYRRPVFGVDVSGARDKDYIKRVLAQTERIVDEIYPGVKPRFRTQVVDEENISMPQLAKEINDELKQIEEDIHLTPGILEGMSMVREAVAEAEREAANMTPCETVDAAEVLEEKIASLIPETPSASDARKSACRFAAGQATFVLISRVAQVIHDGITLSPRLAATLALTFGDSAITYFTIRLQTKINRLFSHHRIPFASQRVIVQKMLDAYANRPSLQFAKGLLLNVLVYGLGKNLSMQAAGHVSKASTQFQYGAGNLGDAFQNGILEGLQNIGHDWTGIGTHDIYDLGKNSATGAAFYVLGQMGLDLLRQKGWITQAHIEKLFRYLGVLDTFAGVVNSNPTVRDWRILFQGPVWSVYVAAFILGNVLPVRNQRFLLVDSRIKNREDVDMLEVSGITWRTGFKIDEMKLAVAEISKLPRVERKGWCARAMAQASMLPMVAPFLMDK